MNFPSVDMRRARPKTIAAFAFALLVFVFAFAGANALVKFESAVRKAGITGFVATDEGLLLTNSTKSIFLPLGSRQLATDNSIVWLHEAPELPYRATSGWKMSRVDLDRVLLAILAPTQGPPAKLRVAIDAGHGGDDGGASSYDGSILEKDFTLDMAFRLGKLLEDAGMEVFYTRTNDVARTLSQRPALATAKKADVFISLHANKAGNHSAAGCETYVIPCTGYSATGGDNGMPTKWRSGNKNDFLNNVLAYQVHRRLPGRRKGRDRGLRRARFQVLREATCPAILVECGFLSNTGDVKRLKSNWYRGIFAQAICDGIVDYASRIPLESRRTEPPPKVEASSDVAYTVKPDAPAKVEEGSRQSAPTPQPSRNDVKAEAEPEAEPAKEERKMEAESIVKPGDWRDLDAGVKLPASGYCDQPYVVKTDDGAWLCCLTTGPGEEGERGQHVVTMRSMDMGQTWTDIVSVEPDEPRENSYAVLLKGRGNRIFIFYNFNGDNVREVKRHDGNGVFTRVDSLGHFVFKYSDDGGKSWSAERYDIPVRKFKCDRENAYEGELCFFWNVGRAFAIDGVAYVPLIKIGKMGAGFFEQTEGSLLCSQDILSADDPSKATWETLPNGDYGLRAPKNGGPISEEQSYSVLSDGSLYATWRTLGGYAAEAYSRDGGHKWTSPRWRSFADGRPMKHPRAAAFAWRRENGRYLCWFHNHGGTQQAMRKDNSEGYAYQGRNPVWVCVGEEIAGKGGREIAWSQPEILLYDTDVSARISYPDLIEEGERIFITETQKTTARIHEIPADFLQAMDEALSLSLKTATESGPALAALADEAPLLAGTGHGKVGMPRIESKSLSIAVRVDPSKCKPGDVLLSNREGVGHGFALKMSNTLNAVAISFRDGERDFTLQSDGLPKNGAPFFAVVNIDAGPKVVSFSIDGRFCDGGEEVEYGWKRYASDSIDFNGASELEVGEGVQYFAIRPRVMLTAEAVFWKNAL